MSNIEKAMKYSIGLATQTMEAGKGGPFGAAVLDENGEMIALASNSVLEDHDPTAHAEVNAIRQACKVKGTHDLTGCVLIATGYPCPMCLSAMIWANISCVYYAAEPQDCERIGFRDQPMYDYLRGLPSEIELKIIPASCESRMATNEMYDKYAENNNIIY